MYRHMIDTSIAEIAEDGTVLRTCTVEDAKYKTWVEAGNTTQPIAPPTTEELVAEIKAEAQRIIYAKWPLWAQQNCNDGTYSAADKEQMLADKALVLTECTRLVIAIESGQAAIPNWPTI